MSPPIHCIYVVVLSDISFIVRFDCNFFLSDSYTIVVLLFEVTNFQDFMIFVFLAIVIDLSY